jgi:hypothetical protein
MLILRKHMLFHCDKAAEVCRQLGLQELIRLRVDLAGAKNPKITDDEVHC